MYLDFYNLREKPFSLSPDPRFLYYSPSHREALSQMVYAVTQDSGFMMLTGEVGTGKTILVNSLSKKLPEGYLSAKIHFTVFDPRALLEDICREFGIAFTSNSLADLVLKLQQYLKWRYHLGKKSILIVDEAQNLSWESLEMIRLLSNVESMREKFFQIMLVGQPEFEEKLKANELRQLRQRIGLHFRLRALTPEETGNYITHRLAVAKCKRAERFFTGPAIRRIHEFTAGIPRRINILCDNALLYGYATGIPLIDETIIEEVGKDNGIGGNTTHSPAEILSPIAVSKACEVEKSGSTNSVVSTTSTNVSLVEREMMHARELRQVPHGDQDKDLLVLRKPRTRTVFLLALLWFIVLAISLFCAVLLSVKLGFIVFG